MTVLEIIQKSTGFLQDKGVESPRLQSESILAHVLQLPRMQLYLNFQRSLSEPEIAACREMVRRRARREPLQHLLGSVSFCGLEIRVNPHALIPRPETEQLVEHARTLLQAIPDPAPTVLDFGTGTGCIAVAMAVQCPAAQITACDLSPEALTLARENALVHQVQDRITFLHSDGFQALAAGTRFHLIVSNPPYIPTAEIAGLQPEVKEHDPRLALDGGTDGLSFYRLLAAQAPAHLDPRGALVVEFGEGQAKAITGLFSLENWIVEPALADYSERDRFLIARLSPCDGAYLT